MEYLPVVNEEDETLFYAGRDICHNGENPLRHQSVTVLTFNEDKDQILVQKRSENNERKPHLLEFTGGHVKQGESYEEAAVREYAEELFDARPEEAPFEREVLNEEFDLYKESSDNYENVRVYSTVFEETCSFDYCEEVEDAWFEPVDQVLDNVEESPEKFTNSTVRALEEYKDRELVRKYDLASRRVI